MTQPFAVIHGGLYGQSVPRVRPLSYTLYPNELGGRPWVIFHQSPIPNSTNLFDVIWFLDEAIARGFIQAPRAALTVAACNGVRR
jgi:hypothetical protein